LCPPQPASHRCPGPEVERSAAQNLSRNPRCAPPHRHEAAAMVRESRKGKAHLRSGMPTLNAISAYRLAPSQELALASALSSVRAPGEAIGANKRGQAGMIEFLGTPAGDFLDAILASGGSALH